MDVVLLVARVLFGAVFLGGAMGHLTQTAATAGYARSKGVPAPRLTVIGTGLLVVGAVSVVLGLWADAGALLLVLFLLPTAVVMHGFWKETDPMARQMEMTQFLKDVSLAGGGLVAFVLVSRFGDDLGLMLTGPLFG
jgi:putative oxidoreductase